MVGIIRIGQGTMDAIQASAFLSRAVMLGAFTLYEGEAEVDPINEVDVQGLQFDAQVSVDLNEDALARTSAIAGGLVTAAYWWTIKKMVLQSRASFISSVGTKITTVIDELIKGKVGSIRWARSGGLTATRANALTLLKLADEGADAGRIGIELIALKSQIEQTEKLFKIVDETLQTLEYANNLGSPIGLNVDPTTGRLIGLSESALDAKEVGELKKIAGSQTLFGRVRQTPTGPVVQTSRFRPFANKDIALLAEMFIPKNNVDDLFDLKTEFSAIKLAFAEMVDELKPLKKVIKDASDRIQYLTTNPLVSNDQAARGAQEIAKRTGQQAVGATATVGDQIKAVDKVNDTLNNKVATATKVSDGFITRAFGRLAGETAYYTLRVGSGLLVSKETSKKVSQKVATGAKATGRFLGKVFLVDTVVWAGTGVYDLLFVDEDKEYDGAFNQYLTENWGFSPVGWLVDKAVDAVVPPDVQEDVLQGIIDATTAVVASSETLSDLVAGIAAIYIESVDVTILPADLYFYQPTEVDVPFPVIDPLDILFYAFIGCVAKLVFQGWIRPAWGALMRSVDAVG